jgi:hypothetical protein
MKRQERIYLRTSGGMGIPIEGVIEVDALPPRLAREVKSALSPHKLSRAARQGPPAFTPDQIAYEITLVGEPETSEAQHFTILESQADDELLEVLDELTTVILEEKMRARKAAELEDLEEVEVSTEDEDAAWEAEEEAANEQPSPFDL